MPFFRVDRVVANGVEVAWMTAQVAGGRDGEQVPDQMTLRSRLDVLASWRVVPTVVIAISRMSL